MRFNNNPLSLHILNGYKMVDQNKYGTDHTSVRVKQTPGGNSSFSLGWNADEDKKTKQKQEEEAKKKEEQKKKKKKKQYYVHEKKKRKK